MCIRDRSQPTGQKGTRGMQVCHVESAVFDDPNLVSCAGLGPVVALAEQCGLPQLVAAQLTLPAKAGVNAHLKVPALVGAMVAGADSIADADLLRHGGMGRLFGEVRAPSMLGTFLRAFTFGHVRQLDAVAGQLLAGLSRRSPLLPGADQVAYVDIDDTVKATYGYAKQGAGYGYSGVKGLNALLATVSSPLAVPVIVATRLLSLIHISEPTRLLSISYAVFCLKKKKKTNTKNQTTTPPNKQPNHPPLKTQTT